MYLLSPVSLSGHPSNLPKRELCIHSRQVLVHCCYLGLSVDIVRDPRCSYRNKRNLHRGDHKSFLIKVDVCGKLAVRECPVEGMQQGRQAECRASLALHCSRAPARFPLSPWQITSRGHTVRSRHARTHFCVNGYSLVM